MSVLNASSGPIARPIQERKKVQNKVVSRKSKNDVQNAILWVIQNVHMTRGSGMPEQRQCVADVVRKIVQTAKHWGAAIAALVLFFGCARQMPPPGGPPDQTPPYVVTTVPGDDSTGVGLSSPVRITFSENMDRRLVERALFVSPQPQGDINFDWRGNMLEIKMPDGFLADRTYVVTVGQGSSDEWGNRMVASYSFGFATGLVLNQGQISGCVFLPKTNAGQIYVWAYDLQVYPMPDPARDRPAYVTQPDVDGSYAFSRLGPGIYRVFAFQDRDGNQRYTPIIDALAVPPADVPVGAGGDHLVLGDLVLVVRDTLALEPVEVKVADSSGLGMLSGRVVPKAGFLFCVALGAIKNRYQTHLSVGDSAFVLSGMVPGSYRLDVFLDQNGDGIWTPGVAVPFESAEPVVIGKDTLEVRARWETVSEHVIDVQPWWMFTEEGTVP